MPIGTRSPARALLVGSLAAVLLLSGCTKSATSLPSSVPLTPGGSFVGTLPGETDGSATGSPDASSAPSTMSDAPDPTTSLSSPLGLTTPSRTSPASSLPSSATAPRSTGSTGSTGSSVPTSTPTSPTRPPASNSTGGSSPKQPPTSPPKVTVATSGLSAEEIADRTAIEQAWLHYWDIYLKFYDATPAQRVQLLKGVTIEPQTTRLLKAANEFDKQGIRTRGSVMHRFYWGPPAAGEALIVVGDCMDTSKYGSFYKATGLERSMGVKRANFRVIMKRSSNNWLIQQVEVHDQPC